MLWLLLLVGDLQTNAGEFKSPVNSCINIVLISSKHGYVSECLVLASPFSHASKSGNLLIYNTCIGL
jgi:hypothetical protein